MVWYFHLIKNFPQLVVIHTVKGFSIPLAGRNYILIFDLFSQKLVFPFYKHVKEEIFNYLPVTDTQKTLLLLIKRHI